MLDVVESSTTSQLVSKNGGCVSGGFGALRIGSGSFQGAYGGHGGHYCLTVGVVQCFGKLVYCVVVRVFEVVFLRGVSGSKGFTNPSYGFPGLFEPGDWSLMVQVVKEQIGDGLVGAWEYRFRVVFDYLFICEAVVFDCVGTSDSEEHVPLFPFVEPVVFVHVAEVVYDRSQVAEESSAPFLAYKIFDGFLCGRFFFVVFARLVMAPVE